MSADRWPAFNGAGQPKIKIQQQLQLQTRFEAVSISVIPEKGMMHPSSEANKEIMRRTNT